MNENLRESLLNRINGSRMTRTAILRQVGYKWRLESYTETFGEKGNDLVTRLTSVVPHTTDETFPTRNIETPCPPLPSTRKEWDMLVEEWKEGGSVDLITFNGPDSLDSETRKKYEKRESRDKKVEERWFDLMKKTWKKVHGEGPVPVGARVTLEDLRDTLTEEQFNKYIQL